MELKYPKMFIKLECNADVIIKKIKEIPIEKNKDRCLAYLEQITRWKVNPFVFKDISLQERVQLNFVENEIGLTKDSVKPYKRATVFIINIEGKISISDIEFNLYTDSSANFYILESDFYVQTLDNTI